MSKFKVGDKIRMKCNCSGAKRGCIYTLTLRTMSDGQKVLFTNLNNGIGDGCSCEYNWILAEEYVKNIKQYGIVKFCQTVDNKRGGSL